MLPLDAAMPRGPLGQAAPAFTRSLEHGVVLTLVTRLSAKYKKFRSRSNANASRLAPRDARSTHLAAQLAMALCLGSLFPPLLHTDTFVMPAIHVILNPNARLNRSDAQTRIVQLQRIVGSHGWVHYTRTLDDLRSIIRSIAPTCSDYLVCDGGDGSLHWAVNTVVELVGEDESRLPIFVPARSGTIDFVATKVGIQGSPLRVVQDLVAHLGRGVEPGLQKLDTLAIRGIELGPSGEREFSRIGFALAAGGVGARFFDKYYEERIRGRRAIAKIVGRAVSSHLSDHAGLPLSPGFLSYGRELFRPTRARVTIDGWELPVTEHGALHAGSIDVNFKGILRVFPLAKQAGVLHFQAGSIMPNELIRALPNLYLGTPIRSARLTERGGREMTIVPLDGEVLNPVIDGERFERLERLRVKSGPKLRVPLLRTPAVRVRRL